MSPHWYQLAWIPVWLLAAVALGCYTVACGWVFHRVRQNYRAWRIQQALDEFKTYVPPPMTPDLAKHLARLQSQQNEYDAALLAEERRKFLLIIGGSSKEIH